MSLLLRSVTLWDPQKMFYRLPLKFRVIRVVIIYYRIKNLKRSEVSKLQITADLISWASWNQQLCTTRSEYKYCEKYVEKGFFSIRYFYSFHTNDVLKQPSLWFLMLSFDNALKNIFLQSSTTQLRWKDRIENTKSLKFLNFAPSSVNLVHWHWVKIVSQKCDAPYIVSQSDTKLHTDAEKDSKLLAIWSL